MKSFHLNHVFIHTGLGLSGLTGFPGRPGPPGETVGSDIQGPTGDSGLPGPDGQYGEYISSDPSSLLMYICVASLSFT